MSSSKDLRHNAICIASVLFATLTVAVISPPTNAQTDQEIVTRLHSGAVFLCVTEVSARADTQLKIIHSGLRSNVSDVTITIGRPTVTIPFTGSYGPREGFNKTTNNVSGVITIVRWGTSGVAVKISFTVNPGVIRPTDKEATALSTGEMKFEGAIRLGTIKELQSFMAGTFMLNNPAVRDPLGNEEPRPGPFPFSARQIE